MDDDEQQSDGARLLSIPEVVPIPARSFAVNRAQGPLKCVGERSLHNCNRLNKNIRRRERKKPKGKRDERLDETHIQNDYFTRLIVSYPPCPIHGLTHIVKTCIIYPRRDPENADSRVKRAKAPS